MVMAIDRAPYVVTRFTKAAAFLTMVPVLTETERWEITAGIRDTGTTAHMAHTIRIITARIRHGLTIPTASDFSSHLAIESVFGSLTE
jgi:hypothetical protein